MTPQVNLGGRNRQAEALPVERAETAAPHELTYAERQGLAMGWVAIALGLFLLLGGLALWAAAALGGGFTGWLIGMAVMGTVVVASLIAISYLIIRPRR